MRLPQQWRFQVIVTSSGRWRCVNLRAVLEAHWKTPHPEDDRTVNAVDDDRIGKLWWTFMNYHSLWWSIIARDAPSGIFHQLEIDAFPVGHTVDFQAAMLECQSVSVLGNAIYLYLSLFICSNLHVHLYLLYVLYNYKNYIHMFSRILQTGPSKKTHQKPKNVPSECL